MEDIFEEIIRLKRKGERAALATVTMTKGSTPREQGAKMLVKSDGTIVGSVGGGSLELEVCKEAIKVIAEGKAKVLHFDLTGREAAEIGMVCGGVMDVFIEPIGPPPTLYIFGGGHISLSLAKIGKMLEFRVVVIDDSPEFANRERFPEADEILVRDFGSVYPQLEINEPSYIVIVTRGHLSDEMVLEQALKTNALYIGMIGSKKKIKTVYSHLQSRGISKEVLQKVHAPIGLEISAETPEEIAVSILAEIIKVKRTSQVPHSK